MSRILDTYSAPRLHWVGDDVRFCLMISPQIHGEDLSPFTPLDYAAAETFTATAERCGVGQHPHEDLG